MSAALDIVDHDIMITRLEKLISVIGSAISWIHSYLSDWTQSVKIPGGASDGTKISFGVPQCSALGPLLFTIYMAPISDIIKLHHLNYRLYADDTQLYFKFNITDGNDRLSMLRRIKKYVNDIHAWMNSNLLKVNDDKTIMLAVVSRNNQKKR